MLLSSSAVNCGEVELMLPVLPGSKFQALGRPVHPEGAAARGSDSTKFSRESQDIHVFWREGRKLSWSAKTVWVNNSE